MEFGASREGHLTGLPCFSQALEDSMEEISRMFLAILHISKDGQEQDAWLGKCEVVTGRYLLRSDAAGKMAQGGH